MSLIKAENVTVELNGMKIIENAALHIRQGERIALIGSNGIGKTTFLLAILGRLPIAKGTISRELSAEEIGLMLDDDHPFEGTVMDFMREGNETCSRLKERIEQLNTQWTERSGDELFIEEYNDLLQQYSDVNGYDWELSIERILKELKVSEDLWGNLYSSLSGGQKTRVKLARLMVLRPKLLILDEPTNHLDVESVEWLAGWLNEYRGTVLFISHEREFIDKTATAVYELTETGTHRYDGGYSAYRTLKDEEIKTAQSLYQKQQQERKKLIEIIQQYKQYYQKASGAASVRDPYAQKQAGRQAAQVKAKEKALEKLDQARIEKPREKKKIEAGFESESFDGKQMAAFKDVTFSYNESPLFENIHLYIHRGERIAVTGRNGSGKTTLLKLLSGRLVPDKGIIILNPQLKIGYFMQELEGLSKENTILEEILGIKEMTQEEARTILACFLFRRDDVFKKIESLSMGEKCRVAFVKLYFSDANLLVLDEPTNYLDIHAREQIEEALMGYHGSVVMVSHDPYLLRKVSNRVLHINQGNLQDFTGGYKEWEKYEKRDAREQERTNEKILLELKLAELLSDEEENLEAVLAVKRQLVQLNKLR
ncbi:ribosomal protection-like ABC-F family protein [Peribacillus kribbensis]|uniref:ribosomal protection-like ABC-F family protein n=1 Tax=Peribacillus kribbensis TaxID=356658 RepID=UPI00040C0F6B|nr:ABC-F type ribosomal protection protein [Peribacillus kribbensis]